MALINCTKCGHLVSDKAFRICPNCGCLRDDETTVIAPPFGYSLSCQHPSADHLFNLYISYSQRMVVVKRLSAPLYRDYIHIKLLSLSFHQQQSGKGANLEQKKALAIKKKKIAEKEKQRAEEEKRLADKHPKQKKHAWNRRNRQE